MRYHFGLGVGHAYSHSEFHTVAATINEHYESPNTPSGSHIPETFTPSLVRHLTSKPTNSEEEAEEQGLSTEDEDADEDIDDSADEHSVDLGSDDGSDSEFNEGRLDWDEELIAEEMYEE